MPEPVRVLDVRTSVRLEAPVEMIRPPDAASNSLIVKFCSDPPEFVIMPPVATRKGMAVVVVFEPIIEIVLLTPITRAPPPKVVVPLVTAGEITRRRLRSKTSVEEMDAGLVPPPAVAENQVARVFQSWFGEVWLACKYHREPVGRARRAWIPIDLDSLDCSRSVVAETFSKETEWMADGPVVPSKTIATVSKRSGPSVKLAEHFAPSISSETTKAPFGVFATVSIARREVPAGVIGAEARSRKAFADQRSRSTEERPASEISPFAGEHCPTKPRYAPPADQGVSAARWFPLESKSPIPHRDGGSPGASVTETTKDSPGFRDSGAGK